VCDNKRSLDNHFHTLKICPQAIACPPAIAWPAGSATQPAKLPKPR
jgi:hypothetical protein